MIHLWMGFNTIMSFPRYMRVVLLGIISVCFIFLPLDSVYAENEEIDVSIGFDFSFGEIIDNEKILSGTVITSEENIIVSWDIQNSTGFKFNWGDFNSIGSGDLSEVSQNYFSLEWEVSVNSIDYYSCSCQLNIYVGYENNLIHESSMPFFILNDMYYSDSNHSMLISNPSDMGWINGDLIIEAQAKDIHGNQPSSVQIYLNRYVTFTETCSGDITYSDDNIITPLYNEDNSFTYHFDMNSQPDGWYELIILIPSENSLNEYDVYSCMSLKLNNLMPVISILDNPSNQFEDDGFLIIDASSSEDPVWTEDVLYYIWTCTNSVTSDILIHEGFNQGIFELSLEDSADYTLKLEIMDQGGLSSNEEFNFSISNKLPDISLLINDVEVIDGEDIKLNDIGNIILDGSNSDDTINDLDNLRCIWSINTVAIFEGCERELTWPEENIDDKELVLRLDVMDDDGAYSSVSVKLINPNADNPLPYPIIVLFISFLFLISSVFYRFRKDSESSSIPKWSKEK